MYHEINDNGFHLYEIPNEILLDIMIHLDEISLLDMSQVCSRFRAVAKEAFAKKFTGRTSTDYFEIKAFCEYRTEEYIRYRPFFYVFGENMCAIDIRLFDDAPVARNHWLIELIQRYCASLSKLTIFGGSQLDLVGIIGPRQKSTLTHIRLYGVKLLDNSWANQNYPRLIGFDAHYSIEQNVLDSFLSNNRQIEELDFSYCRFQFDVFLLLNGRMNALKTLQIHDYTPMAGDRYNLIQLESLESVELCIDPDTTLNLLRGISEGCKNLKHLYLKENSHHHLSWDDISIQAICNLTNLHSITICAGSLGIFRLSRIVSSLPKLKYLDLKHYYEETEINQNITAIIKCCINLHKLDIEVCSDPPELNRDFMKKMAKITLKSAHLDVTLDRNLKLMSRDGEVWNDDGIIYWDGYHPKFNKSKLNLLNLNDECLGKIAGYLDLYCRCNFYDTCKRTRNAVAEYTSKNKFNASLNMEDRIFQTLGKHIRSMSIDITVVNANNDDNSDDEVIASWSRVNRFCPKIKEMTVTSIFYVLDDIRQIPNLRWPKMKQLIFATPYPVSCRVLRSFECPKLEYLEVRSFAGEFECFFGANCVKWSFHEAFENLKTLKFGCYNENVRKFLNLLDTDICLRIQFLSLTNVQNGQWNMLQIHSKAQRRLNMQLINIMSRFRNLNKLHILIPDLNYSNLQYIFESCAKLNELTICTHGFHFISEIQNLKENCRQIKKLRLVFEHANAVFRTQPLESICKILPGVAFEVIYINGDQAFSAVPTNYDFLRF